MSKPGENRDRPGTVAAHVQRTRHFLDEELHLDQLLELTYPHCLAGQDALDLIVPIIAGKVPTRWTQLASLDLAARAILEMAERSAQTLGHVDPWSATSLDQAFAAIESDCKVKRHDVETVLTVLVLGQLTPLPIAPVFEVVGQARCIARLHRATRVYRDSQMIG